MTDYIAQLHVVYSDGPSGAPEGRVREVNGGNPDINAGFKGEFVWLLPGTTSNASEAATSFEFVSQSNADERFSDLAKGTGGNFRYLIPVHDTHQNAKIFDCALFRTGSAMSLGQMQQMGWSGMSGDINQGRGGDFLYLVWKIR